MVQLAARRALNPKMKVRLLLPEPNSSKVQSLNIGHKTEKQKQSQLTLDLGLWTLDTMQRYFDQPTRLPDASFGARMFIRFTSGELDPYARVRAGLFCAARDLLWSDDLPEYEFDALCELRSWFNTYLDSPFDHLPDHRRYDRAICWFKATAGPYLERAWDLVTILERNDILIWAIRAKKTGYIYYEDDAQVFAEPFHDLRQILLDGGK